MAQKGRRKDEGRVSARGRAGGPTRRTEQLRGPELGLGEGAGECVGGRERQHPEAAASRPAGGKGGEEGSRSWGRGPRQKGPTTGSLRSDRWKGLRRGDAESQAQRPEVGEGADKGLEQMRAAGARNRAQDTENGNGGGGCEGMKRARGGEHPGVHPSQHTRVQLRTRTNARTPWL